MPESIPDRLALVNDTAGGYPGSPPHGCRVVLKAGHGPDSLPARILILSMDD
jgi:hypothetical protein